ncbi:helix-turn-helix domain-containing protein [Pararcticibacter amylolyticus]|uniref:AraC family transcriptional regulator n=1 Tax=Pararcticibacter amylolyticus TaxID=2173175 RepID=A0A2U2PJ87_9SPHI|nr:helix-turn-helix domain-containing protein [Pararcticibacter amylolyticus]PWG81467.1 AraC family transcriptional regulator [Pararcticibacter amylolyticus]
MKHDIPIYDIDSLSALRSEEIMVSRFGVYSKKHHHLHYPHRHSFYHVVLFTEGGGFQFIDFERFEVKPWQIYFMIPGQVHGWNFDKPADGYVVNFSATYFQSFLLKTDYLRKFSFFGGLANESVLDIPDESRKEIRDLFEELLKAVTSDSRFRDDYTRILLLKAFILISDLVPEKDSAYVSSYNYTLLKNFQQLIEDNYTVLRLPREYAELLYITPNHLNALCNDLLGIPAGEVIRNRVILEAKRLLVNLDLPVTEISYQLNFKDNSYFSRFFKKYTGETPEEFRKNTFKK